MDETNVIVLSIVLVILLLLSSFFSATETAYTSMNVVRMKFLAANKRAAKRALWLHEHFDKTLSTLLIGNNIVNISSASIATIIFTFCFGDSGVIISTTIMTVVVLIFGEITPKSLAKERPEAFAMFASMPLLIFYKLFTPFNYLFEQWKKLLRKIFRLDKNARAMTEDEFKIIVDDIMEDGVINQTEQSLINNALKYDETVVGNIMTPIRDTTFVNIKMPIMQIKEIFDETNFSRLPVYSGTKHKIVGILFLADFYELLTDGGTSIKPIIKKALWTNPKAKISALFLRMQTTKQHLAIVRADDQVQGIITMEDILEELVGEIEDETD